jgi:hypothetical protein
MSDISGTHPSHDFDIVMIIVQTRLDRPMKPMKLVAASMTIWLWINTYNYHFYEEKHPYPAAVFI